MFSGDSNSFDTGIAAYFKSADVAIVLSHIIFWLKNNKSKGKNHFEGRTWMYETVAEMAAHFSYLTDRQIRFCVDKLLKEKILIKGYFNKSKFDRTTWYALNDESPLKNSICQNCQMGSTELSNETDEIGKTLYNVIDMKTDKKTDMSEPSTQHNINYHDTPGSEHSLGRANFLYSKLKEINPKLSEPNFMKWEKDLEKMIRVDKRTDEELKKIIEYIVEQHKTASGDFTWSNAVQSPEKLRKHFAAIWMQMTKVNPKKLKEEQEKNKVDMVKANRKWAEEVHQRTYPLQKGSQIFRIQDTCVWLRKEPLGFMENGFQEQVENFLRKNGVWS